MEWYFWLGICVVGILAYLGLGRVIATLIGEWLGKKAKGLPRSWVIRVIRAITIGWPLFAIVIMLGVGFVLAVILSLIAIVLCAIVGLLALALGLASLILIAIIILSPIDGFVALQGMITRGGKEE